MILTSGFIREVRANFPRARITLVVSPLVFPIVELCPNLPHGKILNLVGKTSLRESEALTAQADFYLGNVTGNMHMAAAAKIPVLALYREAVDRENILTAYLSEYRRFSPYQTKAVALRPAHQLDECETLPPCYGGCHHSEAHCITQITPQEIIAGFEQLEKMV